MFIPKVINGDFNANFEIIKYDIFMFDQVNVHVRKRNLINV